MSAGGGGFKDGLRELGFRLRSALTWSPRFPTPRPRRFENDLRRLSREARTRAERLSNDHPALASWSTRLAFPEWHEALYVLDVWKTLLHDETHRLAALDREPRALDVGSKNGIHLPALHTLFPAAWTLVELDSHRRYAGGFTRRARAEALLPFAPGSRFLGRSVRELSRDDDGPFQLVTWTLPFVFVEPLRAWGLPDRTFEPEALLSHVLGLLAPGGLLLIANQGEVERDEQLRLLARTDASVEAVRPLESPLSPFRRTRWGLRVRRSGTNDAL